MPIKYNEDKVINAFKDFFKSSDNEKISKDNKKWAKLYDKKFLNWGGLSKDTKKPYIEILAQCILNNIEGIKNGVWNKHIQRKYYWKKVHNIDSRKTGSNRQEELTAYEIYKQNNGNYKCFGKIIDFQTPLVNNYENKKYKDIGKIDIGKIDLLSYDDKNKIMRILEFKREDSKETILRCILEAYTYKRFVDYVREKFLIDFEKPLETKIIPAILVYKNSKILEQRKIESIKKLIKILGIEIFTVYKGENNYIIERFDECN